MAHDHEPGDPAEEIIRNGFTVDAAATPASIDAETRARYALERDAGYRVIDAEALHNGVNLVPGGEGFIQDGAREVRSPWAVWTTSPLLTAKECSEWVQRAEELELETADFIFKTGKKGLERMPTGARRYSATRLVIDAKFAERMKERMQEQVPPQLADGRKFCGVNSQFLVTRYVEGQYFAPHFDGHILNDEEGGAFKGCVTEFTAVVYLTDSFEGGETHYLPGQNSEVAAPALAVKPPPGCAIVHRQGTVLHSGGAVTAGCKYIMQFTLLYEPPSDNMRPALLRWGA